ncbi:MAG: FmdB family zinc ribbon protein [Thermoanaerobaculaceae bacterium]|jgi:putative FmdB family regulatory protein
MPLYEYRCTSCGERTEVLQRLGATPLSQCSHCGGTLQKLISASALKFKGTGWYVTDYAKRSASADSKDSAAAGTAKADTKPESKSESKSESKPADKPASKPAAPESSAKPS